LTTEQDQSAVKSVMPDSMAGIAEILPLLDIGEALILGDSICLPYRIKLDTTSIWPSYIIYLLLLNHQTSPDRMKERSFFLCHNNHINQNVIITAINSGMATHGLV